MLLCLAAGALALVLGAGIADAVGGPVTTRSATGTLGPAPTSGSVKATCPRGKTAVSGGYSTAPYDPTYTNSQIYPSGSFKVGSRGWKEFAYQVGGASGDFTDHVYCRRGPALVTRSATATVVSGGINSATATCPRGRKVVSGGFNSPGYSDDFTGASVQPYAFHKFGARGWLVREINFGATDGSFVAFAYCADRGVQVRTAVTMIQPYPATGSATASCAAGERVISGGSKTPVFDPTTTGPIPGAQIFPYESRRTGRGAWTIRGENYGLTDGILRAFAYCQPR
jgi:hypothetical protein